MTGFIDRTAAACIAALCGSWFAAAAYGAPTVNDGRSLEEIRAVYDALHEEDVAWRKILWKTCLIDGLQESQRSGKPLMLWIFIDRPIDDERC